MTHAPKQIHDLNALPEDRPSIEALLIEVQSEIDDITAQLQEIEVDDSEEDQRWQAAAATARRVRFKVRAALNLRLERLNAADTAGAVAAAMDRRTAQKREAMRQNAEAAEMAARTKAANIAAAVVRDHSDLRLTLAFLKSHHPGVHDAVLEHLVAAKRPEA